MGKQDSLKIKFKEGEHFFSGIEKRDNIYELISQLWNLDMEYRYFMTCIFSLSVNYSCMVRLQMVKQGRLLGQGDAQPAQLLPGTSGDCEAGEVFSEGNISISTVTAGDPLPVPRPKGSSWKEGNQGRNHLDSFSSLVLTVKADLTTRASSGSKSELDGIGQPSESQEGRGFSSPDYPFRTRSGSDEVACIFSPLSPATRALMEQYLDVFSRFCLPSL